MMHPHHMRQQQQQQHSVQPGASYPVLQPTHLARGSSAAPVPAARMYSSSSNNSAVTGQYVTSNDALRRGRGHFEGAGNTGDDYATSSWDSVRSVAPRRGTGDRDYAQEERNLSLVREQQQRAERPQSRGPNPTAVPPEHSGKFTIHAAPQNPSTVASLPPPPVLSAAQQGHLHQILRERDLHERERLERQVHERAASGAAGGRGSELQRRYAQIQHGGASAEREGRYRLSSPSLQQFQHPEQQLVYRQQHQADAQQRFTPVHHTVASLPRYANLSIAVPPYQQSGVPSAVNNAPSPLVPVYSTLSEAIIQQREQQKQQLHIQHQLKQQQHVRALSHQSQMHLAAYQQPQAQQQGCRVRGIGGHARHGSVMPAAAIAGDLHHEGAPPAGPSAIIHTHQVYPHHPRDPVGQARPLRQVQRQASLRPSHSVVDGQVPHVSVDGAAYDTRASSNSELAQQGRFFQGTLPPMMPLHHQERPTPLPLQKAPPMRVVSTQAGTVSTPATPVLVYAYPHGYVVAYQQGYAGTPQKVAAPQPLSAHELQAPRWNPYECVSPAGDISTQPQGFGRVRRERKNKQEPPVVSREGSPMQEGSGSARAAESADFQPEQETKARSRAPLNLSDVIERGFDEQGDEQRREMALAEPLRLEDNHVNVTPPETPVRGSNKKTRGVIGPGEDKENTRVSNVAVVGGNKRVGGSTQSESQEKQLSGKKRGGEQIAKQKLFTGSYFQVSPGSFLQPCKRRRVPSYDNNDTSNTRDGNTA